METDMSDTPPHRDLETEAIAATIEAAMEDVQAGRVTPHEDVARRTRELIDSFRAFPEWSGEEDTQAYRTL